MLKRLKGLLSDSATYGISSMLEQVIGFFLLPLYTRYLTPGDYGVLAMFGILTAILSRLSNLGMTNAIFRRYNLVKDEDARREVVSTGLVSITVSSLLLAIVGFLMVGPLTELLVDDQSHTDLVVLILVSHVFSSVGQVPVVILRADRRVKTAAALNVVTLLINVAADIFLVFYLDMGIRGVVLGGLIAAVTSMLLRFAFVMRSFVPRFQRRTWRAMLAYGLPFLPHQLLAFGLAQFSLYMVSKMLGQDQAGLYNIAMGVAMPLAFVIDSIQQAWVPYKFQIHAEEQAPALMFRSMLTYYSAAVCYLWVGVALWGPEVVRLMTTAAFHDAALLVPFVALIALARGFYFMLGTGIELSDNTRPLPLVSLAGLMVVIAAAFLLIPVIDAYGAAIATSLGWFVMAAVIYFISQTRFKVAYDWLHLSMFVLLAAVMVAVGLSIQQVSLWVRLPILLLLSLGYPVIAVLALNRSEHERERIQILWRRTGRMAAALVNTLQGNAK